MYGTFGEGTTSNYPSKMFRSLRQKFVPGIDNTSSQEGSSSWDNTSQTTEHIRQQDSKTARDVVEQSNDAAKPDTTAQDGVTAAEAITLTWTKTSLGAAYVL